ncbi:MAG TPA: hypothetical protein VD929_00175 [Caulobacteraceae bacterium]|nr:hypothetical protein [Caulobacteraceae bacterium]
MRRDEAEAALRAHYSTAIQPLVSDMVEFLSMARADLGGDLDRLLVLLVIALQTASSPEFRSLPAEVARTGDDLDVFEGRPTNISSVADFTGIPRETVRRKVTELLEAGFIHRTGNDLKMSPEAPRRLLRLVDKVIADAAHAHALVDELGARKKSEA